MNTEEFFDLILPASGHRVIATKAQHNGFDHYFGDTNGWASKASHAVSARGKDVYYGCASYTTKSSRKGENVAAVRSFWIDVDCGPGKPYAKVSEAAKAVLDFATTVGLPTPYVVASGGGIHCYWPMDADIDPTVWRDTASLLKAAAAQADLGQDPSRTADVASILRPVGTLNYKRTSPKEVRVAVEGEVTPHAVIRSALLDYLGQEDDGFDFGSRPDTKALGLNNDLKGGIEYEPSYCEPIADGCAIIGGMRDSKGMVDQPTWYASIGVLAFTDDGEAYIHSWSEGHPSYSEAETDTKIAQARKFAPTTCKKLGENDPAACKACPHFNKITSPIVLGRGGGKPELLGTVEVLDLNRPDLAPTIVSIPVPYYRQRGELGRSDKLAVFGDNGLGDEVLIPFCESLFYPIGRMSVDGLFQLEIEMQTREGSRRFMIDNGLIGRGGSELLGFLAKQEIVPIGRKTAHLMEEYLRKWITEMKETARENKANQAFGWTEEREFVLADVILTPGGGEKRSVLDKVAKGRGPHLVPKGSLEVWKSVVDQAYNYPGQEQYQFLVACGFAAPLLPMMKQVNGVTVYAHSEGSGVGKTTAQRAGLSAWGNWDELQLADNKVTQNYLWRAMGVYHNLPVVFDELTNIDNKIASDLVFSISSGRPKQRLKADGSEQDAGGSWCTILMASGNNLLSEKLSLHRANAEAEISRLFEFTMVPTSNLSPNDAVDLFPKLLENYGHAGKVFARYIVDNYDAVQTALLSAQKELNDKCNIRQSERYWSNLMAAVIVATSICNILGLLRFNVVALRTWIETQLQSNRVGRNEYASDPLELFGKMLSDMWEGILITEGEGDVRRGAPAPLIHGHRPRGQLVGRAILKADRNNRNEKAVLLLNSAAVRDWCNKKGVSAREMLAACYRAGWAEKDLVRYSLGRGTSEYTNVSSYVNCWQLDPDKIAGSLPAGQVSTLVSVINGGLNAGSSTP